MESAVVPLLVEEERSEERGKSPIRIVRSSSPSSHALCHAVSPSGSPVTRPETDRDTPGPSLMPETRADTHSGGFHSPDAPGASVINQDNQTAHRSPSLTREDIGNSIRSPVTNAAPPKVAPPPTSARVTITCWYPTISQRSYGKEKRYLRPPPMVQLDRDAQPSPYSRFDMAVLAAVSPHSDDVVNLASESVPLDHSGCALFKNLYVSATKSKTLNLYITAQKQNTTTSSEVPQNRCERVMSGPVSILSKPARAETKMARPLHPMTTGMTICLFQRLGSQTTRTKYLYVNPKTRAFETSSSTWTPLILEPAPSNVVGEGSKTAVSIPSFATGFGAVTTVGLPPLEHGPPKVKPYALPINAIYPNSLVTLRDPSTGARSERLVLRKVEIGHIVPGADPKQGPLSQLQRVAFAKADSEPGIKKEKDLYFGCATSSTVVEFLGGTQDTEGRLWLRHRSAPKDDQAERGEELDDAVCWTVVAVASFKHTF